MVKSYRMFDNTEYRLRYSGDKSTAEMLARQYSIIGFKHRITKSNNEYHLYVSIYPNNIIY